MIPANPPALADFLTAHASRIVPMGLACLIRFGAMEFGEEWAGEVLLI